jgi:hypothetical protein
VPSQEFLFQLPPELTANKMAEILLSFQVLPLAAVLTQSDGKNAFLQLNGLFALQEVFLPLMFPLELNALIMMPVKWFSMLLEADALLEPKLVLMETLNSPSADLLAL